MPKIQLAQARGAPTTASTYDLVRPGFGTPKAGLLTLTGATANATFSAGARNSIAFFDGTTLGSLNCASADNVSPSESSTRLAHEEFGVKDPSTAIDWELGPYTFNSFIEDGVRFNNSSQLAGTLQSLVLFGGDDLSAKAGYGSVPANNSLAFTVGFEPDVVLIATGSGGNDFDTNAVNYLFTFGCIANKSPIVHRGYSLFDWTGLTTSNIISVYRDDGIPAGSFSAQLTGTFQANGFTLTNGLNLAVPITYLALKFGGHQFDLNTYTTPSATGKRRVTGLGFTPHALIGGFTNANTTNANETTAVDCESAGVCFATREQGYLQFTSHDDAIGTMDVDSYTDGGLWLYGHSQTSGDVYKATLSSIQHDGWTEDYSLASADRRYWVLAIEQEPAVHYFFDPDVGSFWPLQLADADFEPTAIWTHTPLGDENKSDLILGCVDGYARQFDKTLFQDDGTAFTSKVLLGPLMVGSSSMLEGIVEQIEGVLTSISGEVDWELRLGDTYESVAGESATADETGTWTVASLNPLDRPRRRGMAFSLLLTNGESNDGWSIEEVGVVSSDRGRRRYND